MTGTRSKINDRFEFPHQIDMAPYHVNYQKDTGLPYTPDVFELVGVLVHSGTAESGHYYSYVKERPPNTADGNSWVEFNDMDVTNFDPHHIEDQCFGGYGEAIHYTNNHFLKNWNAYMLFYERIEPRRSHTDLPLSSFGVPAKCALPPEINNQVVLSNSQFLRNYCMFDPGHAVFASQLLGQLRPVNNSTCSEDHNTEKTAIWCSLDHLERVLSRSKDSLEFEKMLHSLSRVIDSCAVCCRLALEWVLNQENALRNLLLRCPNPKVRNEFATTVVAALRHLKKNDPQCYGFQDPGDANPLSFPRELRQAMVFPHIASKLEDLWPSLYMHSRGWDDYFGVLASLAKFGVHEVYVLLSRGFLKGCLEILVADHGKALRLRNENPHYTQYARLVEKGRRYSLTNLVELLAALLDKIDLTIDWVQKPQHRHFDLQCMPLTKQEDELMQMGSDLARSKSSCIFLEKVLNCSDNTSATQIIVRTMTLAEPTFGMIEHVQRTIMGGINIEPAYLAAPFLDAAISFCEAAPTADHAQDMIRYIAAEVDTIGDHGGREHLNFFTRARRLVSLQDGIEEGSFNRAVLRAVPQWAPALLQFREETVRNGTLDLLKLLVFSHDIQTMDDEEHAELIESAAKDLQIACTRRCHTLVRAQKPIDSDRVEQIIRVIRHCLETYYTPEEDQRPIADAQGGSHRGF